MKKEYVLAFSSFYKASYAQEKLAEHGIRAAVRKLPPELMKSCGYALYLSTSSIQSVADILERDEIEFRGAYEIGDMGGKNAYKRVL
ncbi:MAG: DUF3343 domain-containing protein [Firmicutes bacterium]|nr:DUF3343 domain-containing protein [Bacillota bacterium]